MSFQWAPEFILQVFEIGEIKLQFIFKAFILVPKTVIYCDKYYLLYVIYYCDLLYFSQFSTFYFKMVIENWLMGHSYMVGYIDRLYVHIVMSILHRFSQIILWTFSTNLIPIQNWRYLLFNNCLIRTILLPSLYLLSLHGSYILYYKRRLIIVICACWR